MNSGLAASAGEAVGSDCGESAGHVDVLLATIKDADARPYVSWLYNYLPKLLKGN